jgi:CubicO group peptidase (beta-lactamase class C family)
MTPRSAVLFAILSLSVVVESVDVLHDLLVGGVNNSVYPGTVAVVGNLDGLIYSSAVGWHSYNTSDTEVKLDTLFDLASLTKVVSTTSVVALLYQHGYISLDDKVGDILGERFNNGGKEKIAVLNCLLHNAGFSPDPVPWYWDPTFGCPNTGDASPAEDFSCLNTLIYNSFLEETLVTAPGEAYVYSDLSFITLQMVVGTIALKSRLVTPGDMAQCLRLPTADSHHGINESSAPLPQQLVCAYEAFVRTQVFHRPAESLTGDSTHWMPHTTFLPADQVWHTAAPTLNDTGEGSYTHKRLQGQVADGDCYAMGGIAGHAGVFSTAPDVATLAQYLLHQAVAARSASPQSAPASLHSVAGSEKANVLPFLNATTVKLFSTVYNVTQSSRALGWSTNTPKVDTTPVLFGVWHCIYAPIICVCF